MNFYFYYLFIFAIRVMMIEEDVMPFHVIEKGLAESHFGFVIKPYIPA